MNIFTAQFLFPKVHPVCTQNYESLPIQLANSMLRAKSKETRFRAKKFYDPF